MSRRAQPEKWALLLCTVASTAALPAHATFSVIAVDTHSGQVGGASASCAGDYDLGRTLRTIPSLGVVVGQGSRNDDTRDYAEQLLRCGFTPEEVVGKLREAEFDAAIETRQYAIVDLMGRTGGFSGEEASEFKDGWFGDVEGFYFGVQGNLLDGAAVLAVLSNSFQDDACDLAERLMDSIEAPSRAGVGDGRCLEREGTSSDSAALLVVDADGEVVVDLDVRDTGRVDAVTALRELYEAWRTDYGCPEAQTEWSVRDPEPELCGGAAFETVEDVLLGEGALSAIESTEDSAGDADGVSDADGASDADEAADGAEGADAELDFDGELSEFVELVEAEGERELDPGSGEDDTAPHDEFVGMAAPELAREHQTSSLDGGCSVAAPRGDRPHGAGAWALLALALWLRRPRR